MVCQSILSFSQSSDNDSEKTIWQYSKDEEIDGLTISDLMQEEEFSCAIYVPAQAYVGNEIRTVRLGFNESAKNVKIRIWEKLTKDPVYEEEVGDVDVTSSKWQEFTLKTPFEITEEKPLYIGYSLNIEPNKKPIGIHKDISPRSYSFFFRQRDYEWNDLSSQFAPVCIQAYVYGNLTQKRSVDVGGETSIVSKPGQNATVNLNLINCGTSAANVVDIEYTINGKTNKLTSQNATARSFDQVIFPLEVQVPEELGYYTLTVKVSKIDGRNNEFTGKDHEISVAVLENPAKRVVVCEELTGTGCAYCPKGIEGLRIMYEKYPDTFLGIAVHEFNGGDKMAVTDGSYDEINTKLVNAPTCMIDRNDNLIGDPYSKIEEMYLQEAGKYPNMKVDMYVNPTNDNKEMEITTDLTFINSNMDCNYKIAFVVIEDKVDKDKDGNKLVQYNAGFSGTPGAMHGWGDRDVYVEWSFDDVARGIYNYNGISNSVPEKVIANQTYRYTYKLDVPYVLNIENIRIAALIINADTKLIENAGIIKYSDFGQEPPVVGINSTKEDESIKVRNTENGFELISQSENESDVYVYTVSGVMKYNLKSNSNNIEIPITDPGVYIIRVIQGNHTTDIKVVK